MKIVPADVGAGMRNGMQGKRAARGSIHVRTLARHIIRSEVQALEEMK